jgi:formamidopyrimidine-DNA glycosylase
MAEDLTGRKILALERRAKYLVIRLEGELVWLVHLGMTGRFTLSPTDPGDPGKHDHVLLWMDGGGHVAFNDVRRFGSMDLFAAQTLASHKSLRDLGPEPLSDNWCSESLATALEGKRTSLKSALLDQRVVAGLGNIYVCEILNRAGLSPRRAAHTIVGKGGRSTARTARIVAQTRAVLKEAIAAGGSTLKDFAGVEGDLGYFPHSFAVYGREGAPCRAPHCEALIERIVQSGRSTFFCPSCQR